MVLQIITVYHESWVIISIDLTKKSYFSVGKKSFLAGFVKMITFYTGGVQPNDYSITWEGGSPGTPNCDYVICARPLITF